MPQPSPFTLHLGTQLVGHGADPGLPRDHKTVFLRLALATPSTRRFEVWCFLLLTAGWSRVFLRVHFPIDVVAALPVATLGALFTRDLRHPVIPAVHNMLFLYDRLTNAARSWWMAAREA